MADHFQLTTLDVVVGDPLKGGGFAGPTWAAENKFPFEFRAVTS